MAIGPEREFGAETGSFLEALPEWYLALRNLPFIRIVEVDGRNIKSLDNGPAVEAARTILEQWGEDQSIVASTYRFETAADCALPTLGPNLTLFDYETGMETDGHGVQRQSGTRIPPEGPDDVAYYEPAIPVLRLSPVLFSANGRYALVDTTFDCGGFCGMGLLYLLEQTDSGDWIVVGLRQTLFV
jgi:hypothetical protein